MRKRKLLKASALLSSVLVLTTCLIFLQFYQEIYRNSMENDFLLIEYLLNN
ncbi:hypothetical protein LACWKB8_0743 [Lactobacillus sp. wkB8]|nr:hypothetical protein LACWKB8_0743 [Lactobacillus sp. wkB8]